jgi:ATP-dependent helicase/DNAse subunit B
MGSEGPSVTYAVKDLLDKLEKVLTHEMERILVRVEEVRGELATKASVASLEQLSNRFEQSERRTEDRFEEDERRISRVELATATTQAASKATLAGYALIIGFVFSLIGTLVYLVAAGGHP